MSGFQGEHIRWITAKEIEDGKVRTGVRTYNHMFDCRCLLIHPSIIEQTETDEEKATRNQEKASEEWEAVMRELRDAISHRIMGL